MRYGCTHVAAKIEGVLAQSMPRVPIDAESLADHFLVTFEGAFILSKTLDEPKLVAHQFEHFRNYLETLFIKEAA